MFFYLGASQSFTISTQYFACAYAQTGINVDQIYSYEYVKHDPVMWWNSVPSPFTKKLHFINVGVGADVKSEYNPVHLIKSLFEPNDFVAFKLDVDTSDIEIPIFLEILEDPSVHSLIDEFIFELHYNCPVMSKWWGHVVLKANSTKSHALSFNRVTALKMFSDLRHKGVRAHFWV